MVTVVVPTISGTAADQLLVPEAAPEPPVELDQLTAVTPTLSAAVPLMVIEAEEVDTMLAAGDAMRNEGGERSGAPCGGLDGGGGADGGAAGGRTGGKAGGGPGTCGGTTSLLP
jgi:hypothetical protein